MSRVFQHLHALTPVEDEGVFSELYGVRGVLGPWMPQVQERRVFDWGGDKEYHEVERVKDKNVIDRFKCERRSMTGEVYLGKGVAELKRNQIKSILIKWEIIEPECQAEQKSECDKQT